MAKSLTKKIPVPDDVDTRSLFIEHALLLVSELGAHAVSIREIARSAGYSHMAPYKHFKDKDDLFAAIVADGFDALSSRFQEIERSVLAPEKRFQKMGEAYIYFAIQNPQQFKLMFSGFLDDEHPKVKEKSNNCFAYLVRLIEYCQFHKHIKKGSIEDLSSFIWSQIHGFSSLWIEGCFKKVEEDLTEKNLEKFISHQVQMLLSGIKA